MNKENLYKTLVYFDLFSYPLTKIEAETWQWYDKQIVNPQIENSRGFFYLPGRDKNLIVRQVRYKISDKKIIKAKKIIKIMRFLPSVKMIALCNSLGYQNAKETSDIDLFIITASGKIWLTRFWLQAVLKFFRLRPYDRGHKKDGICLTFFITTDSLNIEKIKIDKDDIYLQFWITQLLPLYDPEGFYNKFLSANKWIERELPRFLPYNIDYDWVVKKTFISLFFSVFSFSFWENILKKIQLKIMPNKIKDLANKDSRVILSDNMLKFHGADDNRFNYLIQWKKKLHQQKQ